MVSVRFTATVRKACQALLFPQDCVTCGKWVLNADFSPLCGGCFLLLERLSPRICYCCGIPLPGNLLEVFGICSQCRSQRAGFDFARAYGPYEGKLRQVIRKLKFEGFQQLAHPLAALLEKCYQQSRLELQPNWIVPVPLHPRRKRERGFDQTLLLSRLLSRKLEVPVFRGLRRVRHTVPLFGLTIGERNKTSQARSICAIRTYFPTVTYCLSTT